MALYIFNIGTRFDKKFPASLYDVRIQGWKVEGKNIYLTLLYDKRKFSFYWKCFKIILIVFSWTGCADIFPEICDLYKSFGYCTRSDVSGERVRKDCQKTCGLCIGGKLICHYYRDQFLRFSVYSNKMRSKIDFNLKNNNLFCKF